MTYTLTTAGLRAYKTWFTSVQKQDGLFLPDKPVLTAAAYASLFHFFAKHGSGFYVPGPPIEERMAPVYSRVIGTAQFREFLRLNAAVFLKTGVVRSATAVMEACVRGRYGNIFVLSWATKSTRSSQNAAFREVAVAYRETDDATTATWTHGMLQVDTNDLVLSGGYRLKLQPEEDEYVVGDEAVSFVRGNPDAIFVRLSPTVPVLYSRQSATVRMFIEDLRTALRQRMVLPNLDIDAFEPYLDMTLRVFVERHTIRYLFAPPLPRAAAPVLREEASVAGVEMAEPGPGSGVPSLSSSAPGPSSGVSPESSCAGRAAAS